MFVVFSIVTCYTLFSTRTILRDQVSFQTQSPSEQVLFFLNTRLRTLEFQLVTARGTPPHPYLSLTHVLSLSSQESWK